MKKAEVFFDAITDIREDLIEEALNYRFTKRTAHWQRYLKAAACLALVVLVGFGAIRLGIIGGMGGSDSAANDMAGDSTAPESIDQSSTGESPEKPNTTIPGESGSDSGPGDSDPGDNAASFTATILEVYENALLVKPSPGEAILASADRIAVPLQDLENLWDFRVGEEVVITYSGSIQETYPAMIDQVLEIAPGE